MESIWSRQVQMPKREELQGDIKVQNVVIGAGMAGILTAYLLKKEGADVVVVEAKGIADGQTKNTTAKITSQHGMIYEKLIRKIGKERASEYAMANEDAIKLYERIIKEEKIECQFEKMPAYLYSEDGSKEEELMKEAKAAKELGLSAHFAKREELKELPFEVKAGVCFENQAQFHPLAFIRQLSKKLTVYENTNVIWVKGHMVKTDKGTITAENIVFATHYPFINVPGFYFLRQHQERSYVLALKNCPEAKTEAQNKHSETRGNGDNKLKGMYYSIDKGGLSLRATGDFLLLGGGSHRTGKKSGATVGADGRDCCQQEGFAYLRKMAERHYPEWKEAAAWAAQDCMPHDGVPFIGRYSVFRPYWYVATGFHKWGMTSSMVAAQIISQKICKKEVSYERVFRPQRCYFRAAFQNLLTDLAESVMGLSKGWLGKKEHRCTHLGCRLEWNPEEESWDCPCHGSRFQKNGELIDNPAQTSKKQSAEEHIGSG